ncbi:MAG: PadR family transcriptional regulator [Candidatus Hydrogenedentes bacterium]|nr:PadR family transcriptional regulator [Candidatus Hydrogenedentota bacterium]
MSHTRKLQTQILEALLAGPEFGYPLAQTIKKRTPGLLDNQEALIYPALHELENDGLLISYEQTVKGRPRRYYKLTERGLKHAMKQMDTESERGAAQQLRPLIGNIS